MRVEITSVDAKRARFESARPFNDVREALRQAVPRALPTDAYPAAAAGGITRSIFEELIRSNLGDSEFMLFFELDYSRWLPLYGVNRRALRWILGNPLIAITMIRHDVEAALFAPVELLLRDSDNGPGTTIIYDIPSSLMVVRENPPLLQAALTLDAKLDALVRRVAGLDADAARRE